MLKQQANVPLRIQLRISRKNDSFFDITRLLMNEYIVDLTVCLVLYRYNLQPLMNQDFTTMANISGAKYKFRLCGALADNTCGTGTGTRFYQ